MRQRCESCCLWWYIVTITAIHHHLVNPYHAPSHSVIKCRTFSPRASGGFLFQWGGVTCSDPTKEQRLWNSILSMISLPDSNLFWEVICENLHQRASTAHRRTHEKQQETVATTSFTGTVLLACFTTKCKSEVSAFAFARGCCCRNYGWGQHDATHPDHIVCMNLG